MRSFGRWIADGISGTERIRVAVVGAKGFARALRQRFRKLGRFPAKHFNCVTTRELPRHLDDPTAKGSLMSVTATFGMTLAADVIRSIL